MLLIHCSGSIDHGVKWDSMVELKKTDQEDLKRKYPEAFERPFQP